MEASVRITADDAGCSPTVDEAIRELARLGAVTSVSLLVNFGRAREAVGIINGSVRFGIHFCLSSGSPVAPLSRVQSLVGAEGIFRSPARPQSAKEIPSAIDDFLQVMEHVWDPGQVAVELRSQLDLFRTAVGAEPSFANFHHDVDLLPVVRSAAEREFGGSLVGRQERIRRGAQAGYFFRFFDSGTPTEEVSTEVLRLLDEAADASRAAGGLETEVVIHPGLACSDLSAFTSYEDGRALELEAWRSQRVLTRIRSGTRTNGLWRFHG